MDSLIPPTLEAIRHIRWQLMTGQSVRLAVSSYLQEANHELARQLRYLLARQAQMTLSPSDKVFAKPVHRSLWELIERGLQGQPIADSLACLEEEVESMALRDLEGHVATLPLKALIPLLGLQFPAFIILLLGPIFRDLPL